MKNALALALVILFTFPVFAQVAPEKHAVTFVKFTSPTCTTGFADRMSGEWPELYQHMQDALLPDIVNLQTEWAGMADPPAWHAFALERLTPIVTGYIRAKCDGDAACPFALRSPFLFHPRLRVSDADPQTISDDIYPFGGLNGPDPFPSNQPTPGRCDGADGRLGLLVLLSQVGMVRGSRRLRLHRLRREAHELQRLFAEELCQCPDPSRERSASTNPVGI